MAGWMPVAVAAAVMAAAMVCAPGARGEGPEVLVINSTTALKRTINPDPNTRVVHIKGSRNAPGSRPFVPKDDVCASMTGYYCRNVGRTAYFPSVDEPVGKVSGVAWVNKGELVSRAVLRESAEDSADYSAFDEDVSRNETAPHDTFYYLVIRPNGRTVMVEPHRVEFGQ